MSKALGGVIAAAATPVRADHSIDLDRLVTHCRWVLGDGGCDGINLLGTTGEATSFSVDQRIEAMRAIAKAGLPLERFMVGTGAAAFADAVRLTSTAVELGYAGALVLPPFYFKKGITDDSLVDFIVSLIGRIGSKALQLYLYHYPENAGLPYPVDVVVRLRERFPESLAGLKDSSGDLAYSSELAAKLPGFKVFPSSEATLGRAAELGFAGCISATANVTGRLSQRAWSGPEAERATALAKATAMRSRFTALPLVAAVKAGVAITHDDAEWRRMMPPLAPLSDAAFAEMTGWMAEGG